MSIVIPTRQELYNQIISELESELNIKITQNGKSPFRALATVQAGKLHLYWQQTALVLKNVFPDTADPESIGGTLERFGRVFLRRSRFPAVQGVYTVEVTGVIGAIIPAGTLFVSNDNANSPNKNFVLDIEKTLTAVTDTISIRALEAGLDSQLIVGDNVTSGTPLLNVDDQGEVTVETTAPTPQETIEDYRAAILRSIRLESEGGSATDYRLWANDAQNIRFVYPNVTPLQCSQIDLYIEATQLSSLDGKGTPTQAQISDVTNVINFDPDTTLANRGRRPVLAIVNYIPVSPKDVEIDVLGSGSISTANRTAIQSALVQAVDNIRPFVAAADFEDNRNDSLSVNLAISIIQNILDTGETFSSLTLTIDSVSVPISRQFVNGDIPFLNPSDVTFSA